MRVVIGFPLIASIIEFEPFLGEDIEVYLKEFEEWYSKNFSPWKKSSRGVFDVNTVIDWIKEVAPEANPKIIVEEIDPDEVDPDLPGMYF